ncbi:glycosyltransferase family 4 protein [Croceicoccus sp. F390]|uniref:Glycosyltransferase family 4 protein n=1 Tax=Croceicoccus esteveae TaxID=3075597 RepID=A0ABU2ZGL2_9SPHN|nr:glycosyltransferase family 4 protein [Croceicoccus sp. F390]MDT0575722.1 glycosyltransferase family 4 protein [Croceicoccus sp. F390]
MNIAVFHPGTQHSWQTALALQQLGQLAWYATSIFYQPDRFPYRLERLLPEPLASRLHHEFGRFSHPALDPALVRTAGLAEWAERLLARAGWRSLAKRIDRAGNRRFVAALASDIRSATPFSLWGYSGSARSTFELAQQYGRSCILDRTNGDFRIYNAMMAQVRERYAAWFLPSEERVPERIIEDDAQEYRLADTILVGSEFAATTIRSAERDPVIDARLRVLNYCYDEQLFAACPSPQPVDRTRPVRFLWMGLVIPRKGIQHVLEAIAMIPPSAAQLTIVGDMKLPRDIFARYRDRVTYLPTVPRSAVPAIMADHHVLLLPSHFEGAGITLYEGLAAGCALIQSDRCALAVTPQTGVQIGAPGTAAVHAAMMEAIEDRDRLDGWRAAAQASARAYSFANYRNNIRQLLTDIGI